MNTALWIVQVLCGVCFGVTGFGKVLCYKPTLRNQALQEVTWFFAVPGRSSHRKSQLSQFGTEDPTI